MGRKQKRKGGRTTPKGTRTNQSRSGRRKKLPPPGYSVGRLLDPLFPANEQTLDAAWDYLQRFMVYEGWVRAGAHEDDAAMLEDIPFEHHVVVNRWPEAFEFYRHSLASYLERISGISPWTAHVRSMLNRVSLADPAGAAELRQRALDGKDTYGTQNANTMSAFWTANSHANPEERTRAHLKAYAEAYEMDFPLWYLGVLGKASKKGVVEAGSFGGPNTTVAQGALIDQVVSSLEETPLAELMDDALIPDLRNAASHNDYRLHLDEKRTKVVTVEKVSDGQTWPVEAVQHALFNTLRVCCRVG